MVSYWVILVLWLQTYTHTSGHFSYIEIISDLINWYFFSFPVDSYHNRSVNAWHTVWVTLGLPEWRFHTNLRWGQQIVKWCLRILFNLLKRGLGNLKAHRKPGVARVGEGWSRKKWCCMTKRGRQLCNLWFGFKKKEGSVSYQFQQKIRTSLLNGQFRYYSILLKVKITKLSKGQLILPQSKDCKQNQINTRSAATSCWSYIFTRRLYFPKRYWGI